MKVHLWSPEVTSAGYGIAAFTRAVGDALLDLGHDLRLVVKSDIPGSWRGSPLWGAGRLPSWLRKPAFAAVAAGTCVAERPDRLISTHVNFGPVAMWVKRVAGIRYSLVAHGIDVHDDLAESRKAALRAADRVVAVSSWTRDRVLRLGVDAARVVIVPNTVDDRRFTVGERPQYLVDRYRIQATDKIVLSMARLSAAEGYKGIDRVIDALGAVRGRCGSVRLLVAGDGDDRPRLESAARAAGLLDAVTFTGFLPDAEVPDHYRLADVFAMPSTGEGFGIVFAEALCCGTPVVAGNRDGSVDAVDGGRLGRLVDPMNLSEIAAGVTGILERKGPDLWFDRARLRAAVIARFGRAAFRERVREMLAA